MTDCDLQARAQPEDVERLKRRLRSELRSMVAARYSRATREGWPGRQTGDQRGNYVTGWCSPVI